MTQTLWLLASMALATVIVSLFIVVVRPFVHVADAEPDTWPVAARDFLTARERDFHRLLRSMYPDHHVFAQVALSQLVQLKRGAAAQARVRNHYRQLVADFVLCRPNYDVVAVIEVDDASHDRGKSRDADDRKTKAVHSAGLKLVRIPRGAFPSEETLRSLLGDAGAKHQPHPDASAGSRHLADIIALPVGRPRTRSSKQ